MIDNNTPRYLILGSDERLWNFNCPVVFLGNWCCLYKRKESWSSMDFIIADPFSKLSERKKIHSSARQLERELFPILCDLLNDYHNTQHDNRFWKIVLGLWFYRYINVIYNRIETLNKCINNYNISGLSIIDSSNYDLSTRDSKSAIWSFNDDRWNNMLYSRIIDIIKPSIDFPVDVIYFDDKNTHFIFNNNNNNNNKPLYKMFVSKILRYGNSLLCKFSMKDDNFIINSYLPRVLEMKLNLAFGSLPKIWTNNNYIVNEKSNATVRKNLTDRMSLSCTNSVKSVAQKMLFEMIPVCYLEGFDELFKSSKLKRWPDMPKFIFTSGSYDTDETFKLWTALKVKKGSNYIIAQHGNLGQIESDTQHIIDERVADKFISWGWSDHKRKVLPGFIFKTSGRVVKKRNLSVGILMILCHYPHRSSILDKSVDYIDTFQNHINFIKKLPVELKLLLTIRIHSEWKNFNFNEKERLEIFNGKVNIDYGSGSINSLVENSRIVIHGYDSTGILETLSMNLPTLAFWSGGLENLRDDVKPYYELLVECGIIHFSPESMSSKILDVWQNVDSWWYSKSIQFARKKFCEQYAKKCNRPVGMLVDILNIES